MNGFKRFLVVAGILLVSAAGAVFLSMQRPEPEKKEIEDLDPLVQVHVVEPDSVQLNVDSQGSVQPRTEITISAEVSGQIVRVSPNFASGGMFRRNEELLRIDATTYQAAVAQAEAILDQRQIEFDGITSLKDKGYRARTELAGAKAALETARAELVRAKRNLEKTSIRLPFDAMVRSKNADIGQFVSAGGTLGVVFAIDRAEVRLPLSERDLAFVRLPDQGDAAKPGSSNVTLSSVRNGKIVQWQARIVRSEGVVDEASRQTYAVAEIVDPYQLDGNNAQARVLPIGTFVAASIDGLVVDGLFQVPRAALRKNGQVLLVDDENRLELRDVGLYYSTPDVAFVDSGLSAGDRVVISPLDSPLNGQLVRVSGEPDGTSGKTAEEDRTNASTEAG